MFDALDRDNVCYVTDALEALGQLEQNTSEELIRQRASERLQIRTKVWISPGNPSERDRFRIEGLTGDISSGGSLILAARPALAGDIYWLTFSDEHVSIGSLLARCMRCRMVREDTFEFGFRFFENLDLAGTLRKHEK